MGRAAEGQDTVVHGSAASIGKRMNKFYYRQPVLAENSDIKPTRPAACHWCGERLEWRYHGRYKRWWLTDPAVVDGQHTCPGMTKYAKRLLFVSG